MSPITWQSSVKENAANSSSYVELLSIVAHYKQYKSNIHCLSQAETVYCFCTVSDRMTVRTMAGDPPQNWGQREIRLQLSD